MTTRALLIAAGCAIVLLACGEDSEDELPQADDSAILQIDVEPRTWTPQVGELFSFSAFATTGAGDRPEFTDVVIWASSNDSVVLIDESGRAEAVNAGQGSVTATYQPDTGEPVVGSASVTVLP